MRKVAMAPIRIWFTSRAHPVFDILGEVGESTN
jgi:hypothetical protein